MNDPFEVFQIEPRFDLELDALGQRHRDLSRALHPDRYGGRPAAERRQALNRAIEVNEAWRVLRDPLRRAEALLRRLGVVVSEESQPPADPEFLMEMMERREKLRELGKRGDQAGIAELAKAVRADEQEVFGLLAKGLEAARAGAAPEGLTPLLAKLRYFRRFFDEVDALASD